MGSKPKTIQSKSDLRFLVFFSFATTSRSTSPLCARQRSQFTFGSQPYQATYSQTKQDAYNFLADFHQQTPRREISTCIESPVAISRCAFL